MPKDFLKMNLCLNKISRFILYILKHPVNPVYNMDVVYAGFAWSKNLPGFSCKSDSNECQSMAQNRLIIRRV